MVKLDLNDLPDRPAGWASVFDQLLLGVSHDISNRVATLAGLSDILSGDPTIPPILRALADEVPRLEEGIRLLRLLAVPGRESEEALELTRALDDAISLARLHPASRNVTFDVVGRREDVPPVVGRRTALTHQLVVALATGAVDAVGSVGDDEERGGLVRIPVTFGSDGDYVLVSVGSHDVRARRLIATH